MKAVPSKNFAGLVSQFAAEIQANTKNLDIDPELNEVYQEALEFTEKLILWMQANGNLPNSAAPAILAFLPDILKFLGGNKQAPPPPKDNTAIFVIIAAAVILLVIFLKFK